MDANVKRQEIDFLNWAIGYLATEQLRLVEMAQKITKDAQLLEGHKQALIGRKEQLEKGN